MTTIGCMVPEIFSTTDRMFCHFRPFFALLTPYQPKKSKFLKNVKNLRDIIIWHMCTINDNDMMYGSYDMKHDKHNFLLFWTVFGPFTLLTTQKNQNFENLKKTSADIINLHKCTKIMIMCYTVPEIWHVTDVIVIFHFGLFFALSSC